jgi:hypothetical protein
MDQPTFVAWKRSGKSWRRFVDDRDRPIYDQLFEVFHFLSTALAIQEYAPEIADDMRKEAR